MLDALRVIWQSLKDLWDDFVALIMMNIVWSAAALLMAAPVLIWGPSYPIPALIVSLLLFWPLSIVSGALCFVTNQIARGIAVGWGTFFTGVRRYWLKSIAVTLINVIVLALIVTNIQFYGLVLQGTWTNFAVSAWLVAGIYWLIAQIYWFPMILELESEKLLPALRNALLLVIISPGFSITMAIVLLLLTVLGIALTVPALLFLTSLFLLITNRATRSRLASLQRRSES
jgi:uncharacterized membrane protein YesL